MTQEWRSPQKDRSVEEHPLLIGGQALAFGVGTHAGSRLDVALGGRALRFTARVGVDDETGGKGTVVFRVYADGTLRYDSGLVRGGEAPREVTVDLKGINTLRLTVADGDDGIDYDHADWGEAAIETTEARVVRSLVAPASADAMPPIAPVDRRTTRINGPALLGGTPGRPFLYRVPVSGRRPLRFSAEGLPDTLRLDPVTGAITGTVPVAGRYDVSLRASGSGGTATRKVTMIAGERPLPTPLLGWNSWYAHFLDVDAKGIRAAAHAMVDSGLADFGFRYVNIDDGWEAEERAPDGEIRSNAKFPDMKGLTDEVHALGLRTGLYSSPGPRTCGQYLGSLGHEGQDAQVWSRWGFDLIKYDWCSYGGVAKDGSLPELQKPYRLMQSELARVDRDIALSLCQYGMGDVKTWGADVGGSLWRTTGDITDMWRSVAANGFADGNKGGQIGDDPDMLMVGILKTTGDPKPSRLTKNEQLAQVTLWSLRGAPLLLSCDLTRLDDFTKRLLMNPEVLDVDQDLNTPGARVGGTNGIEVWRRSLDDGTYAVGIFNRNDDPARVAVEPVAWLPPSFVAYRSIGFRDLWTRHDLGRGPKTPTLPAHGARLFRITAR